MVVEGNMMAAEVAEVVSRGGGITPIILAFAAIGLRPYKILMSSAAVA